jgi:hypothetical protein
MILEGSSGSRQRPRQRCATVDHSDIRGSNARTRHHGRDPSGAALRLEARVRPGGHRIGGVEGSRLPSATTAAVCLRLAPSSSCDSLSFSGSLAQRNLYFPLYVYADGPGEVEQLTPHGRDRLLFALATPHQPHIARMQALLRLPGTESYGPPERARPQSGHGGAAASLAHCQSLAHRGAVPIRPGRLYHDPPQVRIAGLADGPAPHPPPSR